MEQNENEIIDSAVISLDNYMRPFGEWYSINELYDIMYQAYKYERYSKAVLEKAINRLKLGNLLYVKLKNGMLYHRHKGYFRKMY